MVFFCILVVPQEREIDLTVLFETEEIGKDNIDKTVDIYNKWKLSYELRHGKECTYKTASDIIAIFKILKTTLGPTLVKNFILKLFNLL